MLALKCTLFLKKFFPDGKSTTEELQARKISVLVKGPDLPTNFSVLLTVISKQRRDNGFINFVSGNVVESRTLK